jgi:uncharacterized protein (DUF885 family)
MRFSLVAVALFGTAFAQKEVFLSGLAGIASALDTLDSAVKKLGAGADAAEFASKSQAVLAAITGATNTINSATALDLIGASSIVGPADKLVTQTSTTVDDIIAKKDVIAKAGKSSAVLGLLKSQQDAANKLASAISSKVPEAAKGIAQGQASKVGAAIDKGVKAFS